MTEITFELVLLRLLDRGSFSSNHDTPTIRENEQTYDLKAGLHKTCSSNGWTPKTRRLKNELLTEVAGIRSVAQSTEII